MGSLRGRCIGVNCFHKLYPFYPTEISYSTAKVMPSHYVKSAYQPQGWRTFFDWASDKGNAFARKQ